MLLSTYHKPLLLLITVPALISLGIGLMPFATLPLEEILQGSSYSQFISIQTTDQARSLLSVIATGAITTLSLTYSIVLLVFTLAAGNIGPRLLRRFSSDLVNQITAGLFGGTFLYSIIALYSIDSDFVPNGTISGAVILAALSVFQLIYFVRHVAETITIDDEIAKISKNLQQNLSELADQTRANQGLPSQNETSKTTTYKAHRTGYIGDINLKLLIEWAHKNDAIIHFTCAHGTFVHKGDDIAKVDMHANTDTDLDCECLSGFIEIDDVRSEAGTIQFEINLLIEIALRALSPSVSDTFTAIACVNSLSAAFAVMARENIHISTQADHNGDIRLVLHGLSLRQLFGQAYHPIRRAATNNILMAQGLAHSLKRLSHIDNDDLCDLVAKHSQLLIDQIEHYKPLAADIESVKELLPSRQSPKDHNCDQ
ncbi:DUF2254 domain-containing protein [Cohaesibacter celericrescens]|uniref:DUF2254 domain-containing protein n=1 Tax=Cohaesibacter celericrescens TaxID=2067669 RepID=A0A2N5XSE6_9HYPH|nr:DUF2254 domain-containing protein [Cohaesibacter celericrescens]PLW77338.1 hypothetical protein C0081_08315 [Cohaesibacter celericrescens]